MALRQSLSKTARLSNLLLYADRGVIILNKPPGLISQGGQTQDGSRSDLDQILEDVQTHFNLLTTPYPVHRLDKGTTGSFLLARSAPLATDLSNQFQGRTVQKTYLALVRGGRKTFSEAGKGTIDVGLMVGRDRVHLDAENGQIALSDWELLGSSEKAPLSLLRLSLHSGVKHQLRVHLASVLHCPVLGDTVYSQKGPSPEVMALIPRNIAMLPKRSSPNQPYEAPKSPRMFLHASRISLFRYRNAGPHKRFRLGVTAPLPPDFVAVCKAAGLHQYLTEETIKGGVDVDGAPVPFDQIVDGVEGKWLRGTL